VFPKEQGLSCPKEQPYSRGIKRKILSKDKIVPQEKKGLSCSLGQLKLIFLGDMIVPCVKPTSSKNNELHICFYIGL
jgi:hypothetical protein